MKFDCEIIQDLLPLYIDDVCSIKSKVVIEEHILECSKCKELLSELGNQAVTQELSIEKNRVIERHLKKERKKEKHNDWADYSSCFNDSSDCMPNL